MALRWSSSLTAMPGVKLELVESVILIRKTCLSLPLTVDPPESLLDGKSDTTLCFVLLRCLLIENSHKTKQSTRNSHGKVSAVAGFEMLQVACSFRRLELKSLLGLQSSSVSCVWIV